MKRILSIDGGGIRGLLPARFLAALERASGRPAASMFDMLAGTSTGGIIAIGLLAGLPAAALVSLYRDKGPAIFPPTDIFAKLREAVDPIYSAEPLEAALLALLGNTWLGETTGPELLVPAYDVTIPDAFFFKSWRARGTHGTPDGDADADDFRLRDIARATSAAPIYFPRAVITSMAGKQHEMIDGGVHSNNPSTAALADARRLWPGEDILLVSLGTGAAEEPFDLGRGGLIDVGPQLPGIFMDGSASRADYEAAQQPGAVYRRYQPDLAEALPDGSHASAAMDDASPENLARLDLLAEAWIARSDVAALARELGA